MDFRLNEALAVNYSSNSQKIRVMSETWVAQNMYCPVCGNPKIAQMANNLPVADIQCDHCGEVFELKSKCGNLGARIADGAYGTMIDRITGINNPDLFIMQYSKSLQVTDLFIVPKFFFTPEIIEMRKPLAASARRAGWVGCNIIYSDIPEQGRISIIRQQELCDKNEVVSRYTQAKRLQTNSIENRGWLFDALNCINTIPQTDFTLSDVYKYTEMLRSRHIDNHNVEAKIRQQLQLLRDKGFIEFVGRGKYRKLI